MKSLTNEACEALFEPMAVADMLSTPAAAASSSEFTTPPTAVTGTPKAQAKAKGAAKAKAKSAAAASSIAELEHLLSNIESAGSKPTEPESGVAESA